MRLGILSDFIFVRVIWKSENRQHRFFKAKPHPGYFPSAQCIASPRSEWFAQRFEAGLRRSQNVALVGQIKLPFYQRRLRMTQSARGGSAPLGIVSCLPQ